MIAYWVGGGKKRVRREYSFLTKMCGFFFLANDYKVLAKAQNVALFNICSYYKSLRI